MVGLLCWHKLGSAGSLGLQQQQACQLVYPTQQHQQLLQMASTQLPLHWQQLQVLLLLPQPVLLGVLCRQTAPPSSYSCL